MQLIQASQARKKLTLIAFNVLMLFMCSNLSAAPLTKNCNERATQNSDSSQQIKVLMLGNSLMGGISSRLTTLLECAGYDAKIVAYNPGGASLAVHNASPTTAKLIAEKFDIVLLQEYSSGIFANHQYPYPVIAQLKKKIAATGSAMAFYQTWGYQPGNADQQIAGYDAVGLFFKAPVYAIGRAWEGLKANKAKPKAINLFSDNHHASIYGQALTSYTLFAYLTQQSPVNLPLLGLTAAEAELLQKAAWATYQKYP